MAKEYKLEFGVVTVGELARKLYGGMGYKGRPYVNTCDDHRKRGQAQFDVYRGRDRNTVLFHIQVPEEGAWIDTLITSARVRLVTDEKPPVDLETTLQELHMITNQK